MKQQDEAALLSDRQLILLAGEAAFGRGVAYFRQGQVLGWNKKGETIVAEVEGGECYHVTLTLNKRGLDGGCDCPASEGIDFCKHCVATALAYRAELGGQERSLEGDEIDRVRAYLQQLDKNSLVDALAELIEEDPVSLHLWSLRADAVLGVLDHKALKKRITAAFPINRDLYRYGQVQTFFAKAEAVVDQLAEQAPRLPPEKCLALVEYAISRMARALETIDDSGGYRFHCEATLQTLHVQSTQRLGWPAEKLANHLYGIAFGDHYDFYPEIPGAYTEALGSEGMEAYQALLQEVWDALPSLPAEAGWSEKFRYRRLREPLLKRAEARGDFVAILALHQKSATSSQDYLEIAELCMTHDAWDQVELWLARAAKAEDKRYPHWRRERERMWIRLLLHRGETEVAAERQWQIYQQTQQLDDYRHLLALAEEHGLATDYRQQVHDWLTERLDQVPQNPWAFAPQAINSLLEIYLFEHRLDDALTLCADRPVNGGLLLKLAQALGDPDKSLPLYLRLVRSEVRNTDNKSYRRAIAQLEELHGTLDTVAQQQAFATALIELRVEFRQKRNFIKWLNEAFPP
ncbi:SWIM zinc finger family protein [Billgrantia desiderata]|uniref:SWIM zinc finger family protein n=1 Tax=Billgrantia desiderata TaxID=52021 RepID=UPI003F3219C3